jgi:hypothetical protein
MLASWGSSQGRLLLLLERRLLPWQLVAQVLP